MGPCVQMGQGVTRQGRTVTAHRLAQWQQGTGGSCARGPGSPGARSLWTALPGDPALEVAAEDSSPALIYRTHR